VLKKFYIPLGKILNTHDRCLFKVFSKF